MKADVQLEHGYVRLANRLLEAILDADFTGTQVRILMSLVRLTYGWRQKTARISVAQLAERCRLSPTGGFRRALHELIAAGVIVEVERAFGQQASVLAIQKDFTRWGRFSIAPDRLESVWGEKPQNIDERLQPTLFGSPLEGIPPATSDPVGSHRTSPQGHTVYPDGGTVRGSNSPEAAVLDPPKDIERQGKTTSTPPARAREAITAEELARPLTELAVKAQRNGDALWVIGEITAALTGMHGPAYTEAEVRLAVADYAKAQEQNRDPFNARRFRRFLDGAREHLTRGGPTGAGASVNGSAAGAVFDDLVKWIQNAGGYRAMTVEKLRELPEQTRAALREIGGHKAIGDADAKGLRILRAQFCRAYGAMAEVPP